MVIQQQSKESGVGLIFMNTDFVYNRAERILRMKDELQSLFWDREDIQTKIEKLEYRIKDLEKKEKVGLV